LSRRAFVQSLVVFDEAARNEIPDAADVPDVMNLSAALAKIAGGFQLITDEVTWENITDALLEIAHGPKLRAA